MTSRSETPRIDELQEALDRGDLDTVRRLLLQLDGEEERLLEEEMGVDALARARGAAARGRRRGKLGKVLVLPGIMGTELDSVDRKGDVDRIWINFVRLVAGRIGDLELTPTGEPARAGVDVRTAGVHRKTYVPILMELDTRWHVRPFPFDWREDLDKSAARLDGEVKAFGAGEPVHLVAHSMGGLVSRRFAQLFPETWRSMADTSGAGRGGRLIMLGTPNRGSFAIPLTLSGAEKLVKMLAHGDLHHSLGELLAIIGTFPGLYQMLPSPLVDLDGDDHVKLFDAKSWGTLPAKAPLLARAKKVIADLDAVIDPQRLVYVAGFNRETPASIRVDSAGKFSYRQTLDGDGRVPHELGLLAGVPTYWVDEVHGDLAKNGQVLDAITELLQTGKTSILTMTKPPKPARRAVTRWRDGEEIAPLSPEVDVILEKAKLRSRAGAPAELSREDEIRLENLTLAEYLGSGTEPAEKAAARSEEVVRRARAGAPLDGSDASEEGTGTAEPVTPIAVEVVWGDVTRLDRADVYAVGHYEGVLPQRAELALDEAVSGVRGKKDYDLRRLLITQRTRRGAMHAALGDLSYFPWHDDGHPGRVVAVAGMGRPGTFDAAGLRRIVNGLLLAVSALPGAGTLCTVLIGSGEGTLTIGQAARAYVEGICDAAEEIAQAGDFTAPVDALVIAERDRGRAEEILEALKAELARSSGESSEDVPIRLRSGLKRCAGGTVSVEEGVALVAETLLGAAVAARGSREARALETLMSQSGPNETVRALALEQLRDEGLETATSPRPRFRVERRSSEWRGTAVPARISFWDDGTIIRAAAIDEAATVPERLVGVGRDVVDDLVAKMTDPAPEEVDELCDLLNRLLVPAEFGDMLNSASLVFEVDRGMARVHWEMLASNDADSVPFSVRRPFARQLRTTYSPAPLRRGRGGEEFRALIVGDPGDPAKGEDLPGARREALVVKALLEEHSDIQVETRIGAPSVPREGELHGIRAADRLEVLSLLLRGGFDLVHYSGHGDFDPAQPNRVGWLFANGLLTPGEIGRLQRVPAVIVSNACLSARTSQVLEGARRADETRSEAGLLPSLADEFFKLGVRNYVGTAWEVNDVGAELFARVFYEALLDGESFGEAIRSAREALWDDKDTYGALWAAYQHYGDPSSAAGLTAFRQNGT